MTYVPTWAGFVYLAMVFDACSRKVVGWGLGEEMTAQLVVSALNMALATRKPDSVIHPADQGASTPVSPSAPAARKWAFARRWARRAMAQHKPWPGAASPRRSGTGPRG